MWSGRLPSPSRADLSFRLFFGHRSEHQRRMRVSAASPHFGSDPDRFREFLRRCSRAQTLGRDDSVFGRTGRIKSNLNSE